MEKEEKKLNMDKVKQVTLIAIALILLGVGFINYNPEEVNDRQMAIVENEDMIGDVQLVSSNAIVENNNTITTAIVENTEEPIIQLENENYFTQTKLERDTMYAKMLDSYEKMLNNDNLAETQKAIAIQEITNINNNQNAIMIAENLICNKGYDDVVVLVNADAINVIVKTSFLSNEDIGKIQNIIEREFNVSLENVNISNR